MMKALGLTLAGLLASTAAFAADAPPAPGSIIWNDPPEASAPAPQSGAPDKNGIIWDAPGTSSAPGARAPASSLPPPGSGAGLSPKRDSIIWDTPGQASNTGANTSPPRTFVPPPATTTAQANAPCREFQTTIVIDGVRQPAHGTACRQADGSWRVTR